MELVEIMIYFGVAILIGSLLIGILTGWHYKDLYDYIKKDISKGKNNGLKKVDKTSATIKIYDFHQSCIKISGNLSLRIYVEGEGILTKKDVFEHFKSLGWCSTIQSKQYDCGENEDVVMNDIQLPKVVILECINNEYIQIA